MRILAWYMARFPIYYYIFKKMVGLSRIAGTWVAKERNLAMKRMTSFLLEFLCNTLETESDDFTVAELSFRGRSRPGWKNCYLYKNYLADMSSRWNVSKNNGLEAEAFSDNGLIPSAKKNPHYIFNSWFYHLPHRAIYQNLINNSVK